MAAVGCSYRHAPLFAKILSVREPRLARDGVLRPSGIIDTLSAGYGIVNRRIWILLIPILLDLFLWLGPQVSVSPLVGQALTRWGAPASLTLEQVQAIDEARRSVMSAADEFNLLSLLSSGLVGVPSLVVVIGGQGPFQLIDNWSMALGVALGAALLGLASGCTYYVLLAQQVRGSVGGATLPWRALGHLWPAWRRVMGLLLVLAGLGVLLGLPLAFVLAGAALVSPVLASIGLACVLMALVWLQLYLFFAPGAIFVSQVGPLQAIRGSVAVVRAHFWPAVLLITLIWVILLGMAQVWVRLATSPGGTLVGILGNAYIASGLVAANLVFYQERMGRKESAER
ncbi:MAG: hypothetical protein HY690_02905 [Chloroflexi bacterium]|nr:hypothetical protein [Chloroflexota bacterium]